MTKTALVTGASAGIGAATVKRLIADGYIVYAAARRVDRMQDLGALGARLVALDLTDDASMVAAVEKIRGDTGRLDVLVNNAGYGSYGALEDVPMEEARRQFEVNLFGAARLCQLALPMMRAQKSGKIVNVSSVGGKAGEPFGSWYHATKYALEGLSDCLRIELTPFGIDVIVIEPGAIRTEWGGIAHQSMLGMSGDTAYGPYVRRHAKMLETIFASNLPSPPEVVGDVIGRAVAARRPRTRYPVGGGAKWMLRLRPFFTDRMIDRRMWRMSQGNSAG
jgi:NAD(P)-dependent dehydrogenase (short-subunit alcohol dehydrogenase family)